MQSSDLGTRLRNPGESRITIVGCKDGDRVAIVDLFEKKKEERMEGCLMVDSDDEDGDNEGLPRPRQIHFEETRSSARTPKPNRKYQG